MCTAFRDDAHAKGKLAEPFLWRASSYKAERSSIEVSPCSYWLLEAWVQLSHLITMGACSDVSHTVLSHPYLRASFKPCTAAA